MAVRIRWARPAAEKGDIDMDDPNDTLAKKIISRLVQEKLLLPRDEPKALTKMAAGTLSGDDWKSLIDSTERGPKAA